MASGATFISFVCAKLFLGVTRTRYPLSLALGGLQSTTKDEGPTSPNWMFVGAGTLAGGLDIKNIVRKCIRM